MGCKHLFKEPKEDCKIDTPPAKTRRLRLVGGTLCSGKFKRILPSVEICLLLSLIPIKTKGNNQEHS